MISSNKTENCLNMFYHFSSYSHIKRLNTHGILEIDEISEVRLIEKNRCES